ncbi:nucleotidyltransferase family protein [Promicromonospora soli]
MTDGVGQDRVQDAVPLLTLLLRDRRDQVVEVAARHGARNVRVFGSVARGEDTAESDIDLLVDLDPGVGLFALGALEVELEELLGREVDVVIARALRESVAATVEAIPL